MSGIWIIAALTIKEAIRRRVFIAALLVAVLIGVFGFLPLHLGRHVKPGFLGDDPATVLDNTSKVLAWQGCGIIKFFASILAVTLAAGAISSEVERGVLSVIVPKPLPRIAIYLGKWIGLMALLLVSVAFWALVLAYSVHRLTGHFHPRIFMGVLATCLFPLLFTTLTLFFSSFCTFALSAGLSLIAAGVALAEDSLLLLGNWVLDSPVLIKVGHFVGYIVPLGRMNHWITRGLGNAGLDLSAIRFPFGPEEAAATTGDLIYVICYIAAALALGLTIFQKRDI